MMIGCALKDNFEVITQIDNAVNEIAKALEKKSKFPFIFLALLPITPGATIYLFLF